jgi:hypothetical protein
MTFSIRLIESGRIRERPFSLKPLGIPEIKLDHDDRDRSIAVEMANDVPKPEVSQMSRINWTVTPPAARPIAATIPTFETTAGGFGPMNGGFAVCGPWAAIYRVAYERALAAATPSRFQRMLEPCWN